jgi:hypothetical protein
MIRTVRRICIVLAGSLGLAAIALPAEAGLILNNHCEPAPVAAHR